MSTRDTRLEFIEALTYPLIIKPSDYSGSIGIKLCNTAADVRAHLAAFVDYIPPGKSNASSEWQLEEFIMGNEFSAEFLDGKCLGITKKFKTNAPFFVEVGHVFPAPLSEEIANRIKVELELVILKLNLTCGPLHLEFIIDLQ